MERSCQHHCPIVALLLIERRELQRAAASKTAQVQTVVDLATSAITALLRTRDAAIITAAD